MLLNLAKLMALSDNPILWGGRKYDDLSPDVDLSDISIQVDEKENDLIEEMEQSAGDLFFRSSLLSVENLLLEELKKFSINKIELSENRINSSKIVLNKIIQNNFTEKPDIPKVMLFELFLVALRDGSISDIERELLFAFQQHYQLDDYIFDDLLKRAEALNNEVNRTLSIILE